MIDVDEVWIPGILRYARFITDQDMIENVWLRGETGLTSVTDYGELIEQIFGGLDSSSIVEDLSSPPMDKELVHRITDFIHTLDKMDRTTFTHNGITEEQILLSNEWKYIQSLAKRVIDRATYLGFPIRNL